MRPVNFEQMMFTIYDRLSAHKVQKIKKLQVYCNCFMINCGRFVNLKEP